MYDFLLDEIQLRDDFESFLNGFLYDRNIDVYVTGSNSKFLFTDIITEFRIRGDFTNVSPLTFQEDYESVQGSKSQASRIVFYWEVCHLFLP